MDDRQRGRLWHVTVTLTGEPMATPLVRRAMERLAEERPFLGSAEASADRAVISYWDEGDSMIDVASLALRLWDEHRVTAGLPAWEVVGLEVLEKSIREDRFSPLDATHGPVIVR